MAHATLLDGIGSGFGDPVFDAQRLFRESLAAMAHPGTIRGVTSDAELPSPLAPASGAVLLALLDPDTRLWLSASFARGAAAAYLRFHTGTRLVERPEEADFAVVAHPDELPPLSRFAAGSDVHPELSATVLLQVDALQARPRWRLSGPGIEREAPFEAAGLGEAFRAQWLDNRRRFPRGVDLLLACGERLAALPRTTRIENAED